MVVVVVAEVQVRERVVVTTVVVVVVVLVAVVVVVVSLPTRLRPTALEEALPTKKTLQEEEAEMWRRRLLRHEPSSKCRSFVQK